MTYFTRDKEAGNIIDWFRTEEEARNAIHAYELEDMDEGTYAEGFYEIATDEEVPPMYQIKAAINLAGFSQADFASRFDIPVGTVHNWCQGVAVPPEWARKLLMEQWEQDIEEDMTVLKDDIVLRLEGPLWTLYYGDTQLECGYFEELMEDAEELARLIEAEDNEAIAAYVKEFGECR